MYSALLTNVKQILSVQDQDSLCGDYRVAQAGKIGSKCNEALSRDLWPLDPFESAPMRATSSVLSYCTLCAITELLKIKELAELLDKKPGSNSPAIEKIALWIFQSRSI
jgi:hypothetical protein